MECCLFEIYLSSTCINSLFNFTAEYCSFYWNSMDIDLVDDIAIRLMDVTHYVSLCALMNIWVVSDSDAHCHNLGAFVMYGFSSFFSRALGEKLPHYKIKFNILINCPTTFQSICSHCLHILTSSIWRLGLCVFLNRHSGGRVVIYHCGSDWHFSKTNVAKHLFRCLLEMCTSSLMKCLFKWHLPILKNELFVIFWLSLKWERALFKSFSSLLIFFFLVCCLYQLLSGLLTCTAIMAQFLLSFCQSLFMYFGDRDQLMEVEFLSAMLWFVLCLMSLFLWFLLYWLPLC